MATLRSAPGVGDPVGVSPADCRRTIVRGRVGYPRPGKVHTRTQVQDTRIASDNARRRVVRFTRPIGTGFGRYDVLKDLCRLERLAAAHGKRFAGYAVFLTNDSRYWTVPRASTAADVAFRLHEGRTLCGELAWGPAQHARHSVVRRSVARLLTHRRRRKRHVSLPRTRRRIAPTRMSRR
jgi:hypothetical protein